jgi:phosphatidylglycerophosphate synthase
MGASLPPFSSVLKSRDVEDPVNLWVHRPLAYGIVALVYRSSITPNQITLVAFILGLMAAACWFVGTPALMVTGGILLWSSAILDGADGILARAKQMQSEEGRALDGTADFLASAATVVAGFYYLWPSPFEPLSPTLMVVAWVTTVAHVYLYDYYKETFLHATRPGRGTPRETAEQVAEKLRRHREQGSGLVVRFALHSHIGLLTNQRRVVGLTNPASLELDKLPVTPESARIYRRRAYGPMQVWTAISLCPHTYLFSISAICLRLDLYLWFRAVVANAIFVFALIWQRWATARALEEIRQLQQRGASGDAPARPSQARR